MLPPSHLLPTFLTPRKRKKGAAKRLTSSDIKEKKLFEIGTEGHTYTDYLPLKELWEGYMKDLIDFPKLTERNLETAKSKICKCDLHGCEINVERSKCVTYVGTTGILLKESKNMFTLITCDNLIKNIPKANSVFTFILGGYKFTVHGNNFLVKSHQRVSKKFKLKPTLDL